MLRRFWIPILILLHIIAVHVSNSKFTYGSDCPRDECKWRERSINYNCTGDDTYHCLLDGNQKPVEFCAKSKNVNAGIEGCPWIFIRNKKVYFGGRLTECQNTNGYCPLSNHTGYKSDELYKYPICLLNISARMNYRENARYCKGTPIATARNYDEKKNQVGILVTATLSAFGVIVLILICLIFCYKKVAKPTQKPRNDDYDKVETALSEI